MAVGRLTVYVAMIVGVRRLLLFQIATGAGLGFDRPSLAWSTLFLSLTVLVGILIHEGGHYLAGVVLGQVCLRFVIGPVELARGDGGWSVRWIPIRRAGLVDLVPATFADFRLRRAGCVAGGPLASLLAGLLFTLVSFGAGTASLFWIWSSMAQWCLVGVLGLLPLRRDSACSDGYLLWELARGGAVVDDLQRNLLVASSHATPLRLRDWPRALIARLPQGQPDQQPREYNAYLAYVHFLDCGEPEAAGPYLDRVMACWAANDPPEYALEAAYYYALHGNDVENGRSWLNLEKGDAEAWVRLRAQAAVACRSGEPRLASELAEEALSLLRAAPACGAREYEIDRLREVVCQSESKNGEPKSSSNRID